MISTQPAVVVVNEVTEYDVRCSVCGWVTTRRSKEDAERRVARHREWHERGGKDGD